MVSFPSWMPDCDSTFLLFGFLFSDANICSTISFPPLGNSDHVAVSVFIDFLSYSQWHALFHSIAYNYSRADWAALQNYLRDVSWKDIFKLCEWVQVGVEVYIPHCKHQVKPHLSPWFSAACAAAIAHKNHFFRLYQQIKSSEFKVKFRKAENRCKRVLEAAKISCANKTRESIIFQEFGSRDFW